jgi:carbamoyl-phosphate synthase small subunit
MDGLDLVKKVTCKKSYNWNKKNKTYKVAAIDYGLKYNILRLIASEDCYIKIFPGSVSADQIKRFNPDGIFLSNGPGDPAAVNYAIENIQKLLQTKIPIFGICLGHQILALALGAKTYKLKFGHRGCNHPVKNLSLKNIEITSQNHGFAVNANNLPKEFTITHTSLNDETIEGIKCNNYPAFSVQYHPESSPGPHDSRYLFTQFIRMMKKYKNAKKK